MKNYQIILCLADKLIELAIADPGNTAAELLGVMATAESRRQQRK